MGKTKRSQATPQIVLGRKTCIKWPRNLREFFEKERSVGMSLKSTCSCVVKRTASATEVSGRSVHSVHKEFITQNGGLLTPLKRYLSSSLQINPDEFDQEVIRHMVHVFMKERSTPHSLQCLKEGRKSAFLRGRFCLWRVLHRMGFSYRREETHLNRDVYSYILASYSKKQTRKQNNCNTWTKHGLIDITQTSCV